MANLIGEVSEQVSFTIERLALWGFLFALIMREHGWMQIFLLVIWLLVVLGGIRREWPQWSSRKKESQERESGVVRVVRRRPINLAVPKAVFLGGGIVIVVVWYVVAVPGPGTFAFWTWTAQSWQAVATAIAGWLLAVFAALTWAVQKDQATLMVRQEQRDEWREARDTFRQ